MRVCIIVQPPVTPARRPSTKVILPIIA